MVDLVTAAWAGQPGFTVDVARRGVWVLVTLRWAASARTAVIQWGEDELCFLLVGDCEIHDYAYDEPDKAEALHDQLGRAREWLDGTVVCSEISLAGTVVERRVRFSDGDYAYWRAPSRQRTALRLRHLVARTVERRVPVPDDPTSPTPPGLRPGL